LRIQADVAAIFQYINSVLLENLPQSPWRKLKALGDFFQSEDFVGHANTPARSNCQTRLRISNTGRRNFGFDESLVQRRTSANNLVPCRRSNREWPMQCCSLLWSVTYLHTECAMRLNFLLPLSCGALCFELRTWLFARAMPPQCRVG
jgi:hypothetical protein